MAEQLRDLKFNFTRNVDGSYFQVSGPWTADHPLFGIAAAFVSTLDRVIAIGECGPLSM